MNNKNTLWLLLGFGIILIAAAIQSFGIAPNGAMQFVRWAGLALTIYAAFMRRDITIWILVSMLIGAEIGYSLPKVGIELDILNKIFMKLIKTVIAPLLFGTLVVGIAGHSDMKQVGRMGLKAIIYFEIVTTIALMIGLIAINLSQAGIGIPQDLAQDVPQHAPPQTWKDIVLHTFPENFIKSIAEGQILQIVVFCILFSAALTQVKQEYRQTMLQFAESLSEIMFKFTNIIMYLAPFAVGGAIAATVAKLGVGVFSNLMMLLGTLYIALIIFVLCVLLPIALYYKIPLRRFWRYASEPVSVAFATTSSEAALPIALEKMKEFGISDKVVSFVLPTGMSFNLDGTTLYLAMASIFVAQAAGIEMPVGAQITMMLTLMLTSKGVAGVSRASLVILAGTAASFGLPEWPIGVIMGIDALMDMARTSVNMLGNCLATAVIAKMEGEELPPDDIPDFTTQ